MNQILIVEDDAALGRGLVLALSDGTRSCTLARSCAEARQALCDHCFSLTLLDINLPDGSGIDLCREIRKTSSVPIIFLTANDMEIDIEHFLRIKQNLNQILAENTGRTPEEVKAASERDHWMSAQEALDFGIIDKIIKNR